MATTRPSGMTIGSPASLVIQEVVEIDGRGRFHVQPRWIGRLAWWPTEGEEAQVLMVFEEPGRIALRDWQTDGLLVEQIAE
jgi:hypothetical protein